MSWSIVKFPENHICECGKQAKYKYSTEKKDQFDFDKEVQYLCSKCFQKKVKRDSDGD